MVILLYINPARDINTNNYNNNDGKNILIYLLPTCLVIGKYTQRHSHCNRVMLLGDTVVGDFSLPSRNRKRSNQFDDTASSHGNNFHPYATSQSRHKKQKSGEVSGQARAPVDGNGHGHGSDNDDEDDSASTTSSPAGTDSDDTNVDNFFLPDPAPVRVDQLRNTKNGTGERRTTDAAERRQQLVQTLGFDPDVKSHSWKCGGVYVQGTHNRYMPQNMKKVHGPGCILCKYLTASAVGHLEITHMNILQALVKLSGDHGTNRDALCNMITSYWNENVANDGEDGCQQVEAVTEKMVKEHLDDIMLDGLDDAATTAKNIKSVEEMLMAHSMLVNDVTGETKPNKDVIQLLLRIPQAKKYIHGTDWRKSSFAIPSMISPDALKTVLPLLCIYK